MLARIQALTSQSLQQWPKYWPVFNGQVIYYISWKRERQAYHRENYPSLQGDALQRVVQ
jgi:hypothetical protein